MKNDKPYVSDHAVLRMLERGYGVDVEGLRDFMREEVRMGIQHDAPRIRIGNIAYVVSDKCVVTVVAPEKWAKMRTHKGNKVRTAKHRKRTRARWLRGE